MKNKFKKTYSMKTQIWLMVMATLVLFLLIFSFINSFVIENAKDDFIFDQLREASRYKEEFSYDDSSGTLVNHFLISKTNDTFELSVDKKTLHNYFDYDDKKEAVYKIAKEVYDNLSGNATISGDFQWESEHYYYFAKTDSIGSSAMVFLTNVEKTPRIPHSFWIALFITLAISYIMTNFISKRISKPIAELENFASDIANRNWSSEAPASNTTEIQSLSTSLSDMKEMLKDTFDRERQFLQSSSHNLKTPVMVIKGYAQALIDKKVIPSDMTPEEIILNEANQLERRIKQITALSIYSGKEESTILYEDIRIDKVINHTIKKFQGIRPDINWDTLLFPVEIEGDSNMLIVAFENLFENQMRFVKSLLSVSMEIMKNNNYEHLKITVKNDGPKFEASDPSCLFERYQKDKLGQSGLGLAIVKQITTLHGGTITAENTADGVQFIMTIPVKTHLD